MIKKLGVFAIFFVLLAPLAVLAQAWPTKPVKIIVTAPPGLPPDVLARGLAQQLEAKLGQPFVIENKPGANNIIGVQACALAAPDGYTFCLTLNDSVSMNPHLYTKLPYDPDKSLAPVAILAWPNSVIVANAQSGIKTFKDAVTQSIKKPSTLNWGSFGNGSSSHLYLEWIRSRTNWDVTHVPYSGGSVQPTLANQVQLTYLTIGALKPHIESGKLIPLAVAGLQRSTYLPDVPTFGEVGLGNFYVRTWFGLFAPTGTSSAIVNELNKQSVAIVNDSAFRARVMDVLTLTPSQETPAEMQAYMKKDREVAGELVRIAKIRLD